MVQGSILTAAVVVVDHRNSTVFKHLLLLFDGRNIVHQSQKVLRSVLVPNLAQIFIAVVSLTRRLDSFRALQKLLQRSDKQFVYLVLFVARVSAHARELRVPEPLRQSSLSHRVEVSLFHFGFLFLNVELEISVLG